jgi:hypothetical protein
MSFFNMPKETEHRLKGFENKVWMRKFEPKKEKVTGGWRKMYKYEIHNLFPLDRRYHKRTCNSNELREKCVKTWQLTLKAETIWEDLGASERNILKYILEK